MRTITEQVSILLMLDFSIKVERKTLPSSENICFNPSYVGFFDKSFMFYSFVIKIIGFNPSYVGFFDKSFCFVCNESHSMMFQSFLCWIFR